MFVSKEEVHAWIQPWYHRQPQIFSHWDIDNHISQWYTCINSYEDYFWNNKQFTVIFLFVTFSFDWSLCIKFQNCINCFRSDIWLHSYPSMWYAAKLSESETCMSFSVVNHGNHKLLFFYYFRKNEWLIFPLLNIWIMIIKYFLR